MSSDLSEYLRPTPTVDSDHPAVAAYAADKTGAAVNPLDRAIALFFAVRDGFRYDPYRVEFTVAGVRASTTLANGYGWCVPKAALLAACCRALGIPARLGYADVRNHLSTERMRRYMKTDVFFWHGYTSIYLDGRWLKATPAFNIELCEKFRLKPLDFDGQRDALFHPFDLAGNRHMDYLNDRGEFADVPVDLIAETFREEYSAAVDRVDADFDTDVDREVADGSRPDNEKGK
jgi:transglutaminase-like putative cysteine protease